MNGEGNEALNGDQDQDEFDATIKTHELKTWKQYFTATLEGRKPFDVRVDDGREFAVGDVVWLREYDRAEGVYTTRELTARISYVLDLVEAPLPSGFRDEVKQTGYRVVVLGLAGIKALHEPVQIER